MFRDAFVTPIRAALAVGAAWALTAAVPALAAAPTSGGVPLASTAVATSTETPAPAAPRAVAAAPRIRVTDSRTVAVVGAQVAYAGKVAHAGRGRIVRLELRRGSDWKVAARDRISTKGRFRVSTEVMRVGDRATRLRIVGRTGAPGTVQRVKRVHGFRRAVASYFGPGLYGSALACGGRLSTSTNGVAHKSLPCGTRLTLRVGGRQVDVRVVDRGPYIGGREFDLTAATRNRLGFGDVGTVLVDK